MKVHGIMCSYLGDGEFDIGKTARWLLGFVDDLFFYDLNYGEAARKYAVDYAKTFPTAKFAYHNANTAPIWTDAPGFRQAAYAAADKAWHYDAADWVIFIDASESLSLNVSYDNIEPPTPLLLPYLQDEVAAASGDAIAFPFYVFLDQGEVLEDSYVVDAALAQSLEDSLAIATDPTDIENLNALVAANTAIYWTCDPHVQDEPAGTAFTRMFRCGSTKDWTTIDTNSEATAPLAVACGIVSYAYARDPLAPSSQADDWFPNRVLTQRFRDMGLPEVWTEADPVGAATSPTGFAVSAAYCYYVDQFPYWDDPNLQAWTALFRQNPRDGVWYIDYSLGPVPVDPITQDPAVNPDTWAGQATSTTGP